MAKKREAPTPAKVESELSSILQDKILLKRTETAIASSLTGFKQDMADRVIKDFSADMQKKLAAFDVVAKQMPTQIDSTVYVIEDKIIPSPKVMTIIEKKEEPEQKPTVEKKTIIAEAAERSPMRASPDTVARDEAADNAREIVETKRNETLDTMSENIKVLTEKLAGMKKGVEEEFSKVTSAEWEFLTLAVAGMLDETVRKLFQSFTGLRTLFGGLLTSVKNAVTLLVKTEVTKLYDIVKQLPGAQKVIDSMNKIKATVTTVKGGKDVLAGAKKAKDVIATVATVKKGVGMLKGASGMAGQALAPAATVLDVVSEKGRTDETSFFYQDEKDRLVRYGHTGKASETEMLETVFTAGAGKTQSWIGGLLGLDKTSKTGDKIDKELKAIESGLKGAGLAGSVWYAAGLFTGGLSLIPGAGASIAGFGSFYGAEKIKQKSEEQREEIKIESETALVKKLNDSIEKMKEKGLPIEVIDKIVHGQEQKIKEIFETYTKTLSEEERANAAKLKEDMTLQFSQHPFATKFAPWDQVRWAFDDLNEKISKEEKRTDGVEKALRAPKPKEEEAAPTVKVPISQRVELDDKSLAALSQPTVREENTTNKTVQIINTTVIKQEAPDLTKFTGAIANLTRAARESGKLRESLALG